MDDNKLNDFVIDLQQLEFSIIGYSREKYQQELHVCLDILITSEQNNFKKQIKKPLYEIQNYLSQLKANKLFLLSGLVQKDVEINDVSNEKEIESIIILVNKLLKELQTRLDMQKLKETYNLLEFEENEVNLLQNKLKKNVYLFYQLPPFLIYQIPHSYEELTVSRIFFEVEYIGICLENKTPLSKLGRVWSLIESDILGAILIFQKKDESQLKYKLLIQKNFDQKVLSMIFVNNTVYFGCHLGYLGFFSPQYVTIDRDNVADCAVKKILLGNDAVIDIQNLDFQGNYLIGIMPNQIKIFDTKSQEMVGGGSLKKRLEGKDLCSCSIDKNHKKIFLGTSGGTILVYDFSQDVTKPTFQEEINHLNKIENIHHLSFSKGNLFVKFNQETFIIKVKTEQTGIFIHTATFRILQDSDHLKSLTINCILYIHQKNLFLAGYSNGTIMYWNTQNGNLICSQIVSNSYQICDIYYDNISDLLIVGHENGVLIYKFCEQEKQLDNENLILDQQQKQQSQQKHKYQQQQQQINQQNQNNKQ